MRIKIILLLFITLVSCSKAQFVDFPEEALADKVTTLDGTEISIGTILKGHRGKTIVLDIWASWCKDCITGMPALKALQETNKEVVFVFLSMDKKPAAWKRGIEKYNITGEHYYIGNDWKTPFNEAIGLDWIPRYMVIGKDGKVKLFKAIKASDDAILKAIKEDQ